MAAGSNTDPVATPNVPRTCALERDVAPSMSSRAMVILPPLGDMHRQLGGLPRKDRRLNLDDGFEMSA